MTEIGELQESKRLGHGICFIFKQGNSRFVGKSSATAVAVHGLQTFWHSRSVSKFPLAPFHLY